MPIKRSKPQSARSMMVAVVIALVSTAALLVFAAAQSPARTASALTITGCLEQHGDGFRLTDANGAEAPKSRGWKFGFLKRGPDAIDLIDAGTTSATHVGTRVRVSGILDDHRMHVRSLIRVADSCS